ncbi:flagellar basal body-associated FliL family protein [Glycomyces dulcitolivorans]|uniref:hypothetical protein n=1 Tax=Glycomyces dulcitolivorans TaxID=2200759 RepID=UPI000DD4D4B7|nr:hypothetical protein [Glycomyces dulcitolivorans]
MTYPPQDPGAVPPGAPDPYGHSQPAAQPPAGGYAPGQVGPDPAYSSAPPTTQMPAAGSPYQDPNAPQYYPQPGYDPNQPYNPYQGYGPPPVQATTKGGGGTALLVIGVVLLMALGAVGGYFWLGGGDPDEGELAGGQDDSSTSQESDPGDDGGETGEEEPEEEAPLPSGTSLTVTSIGSLTPIPAGEWQPYYGPGVANEPLTDSEGYAFYHTEEWISFFGVGLFSGANAQFDPADLRASAASAADVWLTGSFSSVEGYQMGEIAYQDVTVDGKTGVLATWRNSWTSTPGSTDTFEDTAILVVDVDGVNGFLGIASIAQSGTDSYQSAVDALLATDFDAETA